MNLNKLYVKDFGPLNEAEIDISPLTIFVGKNSSGKSFLSSLSYILMNPFNQNFNSNKFLSQSFNNLLKNNKKLFNDFENKLIKYIESQPSFLDSPFEYSLIKFIDLINEGFGKCYTKLIETQLKSNWKTSLNSLNRMKKYPFEINFNDMSFKNVKGRLNCINLKNKFYDLIKLIDFASPIGIKVSTDEEFIKFNIDYQTLVNIYNDNNIESLPQIIYLLIVSYLINKLKINSFYLSANGDDLNKYIANEFVIDDSSNIQKEFIKNLANINQGIEKGYFYDLACQLEEEINHGEIQIKKSNLHDELVFIDEKNSLEFELSLISSSVHELIPFIIYLKYYLNKGDVLIIEEIENHLHPENQLILVKYIVKAINNGLNIILTTHSDYIIEKINNLIYLGNCKKSVFNQLNYDDNCILDYDDVKLYNFKRNGEYNYMPYNVEINFTGFTDENFKEVVDELYDESDIMIDNKLR